MMFIVKSVSLSVKRELYAGVVVATVTYGLEPLGVMMGETQARCYGHEVFMDHVLNRHLLMVRPQARRLQELHDGCLRVG